MATMAENVIAAGSETRPPMLKKGMYNSWKTQIMLYIRCKENGEMLKDSVKHGPYKFKSEITVKDTDDVTDIRRAERLEDLKGDDKLRCDSDIKELMEGTEMTKQERASMLYDEFDKTQATIQNGQVTVQNVQGKQSQGYAGNAENNQASGARVINSIGNTGANQPRVKNSEWFKDKTLLAQAQEAGVVFDEEQQDFLADSLEETDDCEDLQLQVIANFKANHVDAYDSDCDDEATANAIFMTNLSPVGSLNDDTVAPRYDSNTLFEVPHYETYHDSDVLNSNIQELEYIENIVSTNKSYDELNDFPVLLRLSSAAIFVKIRVLQIRIRAIVIENKVKTLTITTFLFPSKKSPPHVFPTYPTTSDVDEECTFPFTNILGYTSTLPNYFPAIPGNISSDFSENYKNDEILLVFSHFYNNPYLKDVQAFYAKESPIPPQDPISPPVILTPSPVLPPSLLFDPRYFFVPQELLPPKKQIHPPSSSLTTLSNSSRKQACILVPPSLSTYTPTPHLIYEFGKSSIKMHVEHHEKQIKSFLNYLEELSFHYIEKIKEKLVNDWIIIPRDFDEVKNQT
ncbi:hypothetical protein Tco_0019457 [Tanacetum coccineum]